MDTKAANTTRCEAAAAAIEGCEPQGQSTAASSSDYESDEEDSSPDQKASSSDSKSGVETSYAEDWNSPDDEE
ncbi:hypothetical protein MKW92_012830 [Papaver armeniacum]|nr:hypothetical protein MKW92_012830 [Papaver armeniacum]